MLKAPTPDPSSGQPEAPDDEARPARSLPEARGDEARPARSLPNAPGDEARLARIVVEHIDLIWRVLVRLGVSRDRAQDEAQHILQVVQRKLADIEPRHERRFVLGVATRVAANARRAQQRERLVPEGDAIERILDGNPTPEELVDQKRKRELLDRLLGELSFGQRVVFVLSEFEGMSRREIALQLQWPEGTVSSRLRLAKERFHRLVKRVHAELEQPTPRRSA